MISELGYKKIKAIVAKNDNEITPEEAATLLILIERSGMMDKVKTAGKILREAANNKDTEFSSVHCTAKNATVKVYGFTEKKVDEESYAKDFPELYNAIMEEKRAKVHLAVGDLSKKEAEIYCYDQKCTAKVKVVLEG